MPKKKTLREQAYETVVRVRGSNDVPGFDLCVESELKRLKAAKLDHTADVLANHRKGAKA